MPASNPDLILTRIAAGEIQGNRAVTFADTIPAAAGAKVLGVAAFDCHAGQPYAVHVTGTGTAIIVAGAAVPLGADVVTDPQGRAVPATGADGERPFGDALTAAAGAGTLIEVLLKH